MSIVLKPFMILFVSMMSSATGQRQLDVLTSGVAFRKSESDSVHGLGHVSVTFDLVTAAAPVPVLLLSLSDQPLQFFDPVCRQSPHNHVLHRVHHLALLAALPPVHSRTNHWLTR